MCLLIMQQMIYIVDLADFSHCDSVTLSTLFKTYCMNLYGSQM